MAASTAAQPQSTAGAAGNPSHSNAPPIQIDVANRKCWKNLLAYIAPGFLACISYIDPGNFATDLQSGAQNKYELLWITLVASCAALIIQFLAAKLGVVTGLHLAKHCGDEYPKVAKYVLWVLAEIGIVVRDIPEVIGTAFALNMLFGIPVWIGVLLTGLTTLVLLALQQYGVRKLEFLIAFLVFAIAACFFAELGYAKPDAKEDLYGLFVPQLKGNGATAHAISLLGAIVMPHNLFLHSALVLSRKIPRSIRGIKATCRFYMIESVLALTVAFLINVSIISVTGAVCNSSNISPKEQASCQGLDLNKASFLLSNVLGSWSSKLFAIALLASGQSSTITETYAGQYVLQGFLDLPCPLWIQIFLTRCLAIVPSLIVAVLGGFAGAGKLIIIASMILSFELPFALIPLLKFTGSKVKMETYANSRLITAFTWVIGTLITVINMYYLATSFIKFLLLGHLKPVEAVFLGIFGISGLAVYLAGIAYLVIRKNKKATNPLPVTTSE